MQKRALRLPRNSVLERLMIASALALPLLFGCGGDPSGPDPFPFTSTFTGFVLEYTDGTRTTTRPVETARLEVLLPDGVTEEYCDADVAFGPVTCRQVQFVRLGFVDSTGRYAIDVLDPAHCALRLRAWEHNIGAGGSGHGEGKTATAPILGTPCENRGTQEGPTLIVE